MSENQINIPTIYHEATEEEIAEREAWAAGSYDRAYAEAQQSRQSAYQLEADPLFFKWQAGEATEQEWLAKRAEIAEAHPYPEKVE